ncbi:MAG: hypothetical protein RH862_13190 [Leptospiraceae bacterium]
MTTPNTRALSTLLILSAILLLIWWMATGGIFLSLNGDFPGSVLHPAWIPVNALGLLGCILLCLGLPILGFHSEGSGPVPFSTGVLISQAGVILFTAIQYYETFLWPVAADFDPSLIALEGALVFGDLRVSVPLVASGLVLATGFLILMIELIRSGETKLWPVLLFLGALLFGSGLIVPVRTIGLLIFTAALIRYGRLNRQEK